MDSINLQRCLVTGANGFVGRALCSVLKQQDLFIRALLRKPPEIANGGNGSYELACDEIHIGDLLGLLDLLGSDPDKLVSDPDKLGSDPSLDNLMHNIDTVFHLAGIAHATKSRSISKETYWQVNVEATEKLLHLAHNAGVKRFIYFSSVKACGEPTDAYGCSKKAAEDCVLFYGKKYGIHVAILRPALVYGPGVKGNLAMMLRGIRQGWFPVLPETKNQRSLVSLEDLIDAAICVAKSSQANGKVYTITDGQCYSSRQLYDAMRKALGKPPAARSVPHFIFQIAAKTGDILQRLLRRDFPYNSDVLEKLLGSAYYSNQDIQHDLGWQPKVNFYVNI